MSRGYGALVEVQRRLAPRVERRGPGLSVSKVRTVVGVDVSYSRTEAFAAAVLVSVPGLRVQRVALHRTGIEVPYIPGLLSFRELPAVLPALERLPGADAVLVDGSGVLHPRRLGLASHLGVATGLPTIGFTKSRLEGEPDREPEPGGLAVPVRLDGHVAGYAYVPPGSRRPVWVSIGHRVSARFALALVRRCQRTRLPEPVRLADRASRHLRRGASTGQIAQALGVAPKNVEEI